MVRLFFVVGAFSAFLAVGLGAFAAHSLKNRLAEEMLSAFEVGVRYQLFHSLALLAVAWALTRWSSTGIAVAGWLFIGGTVLFSGSLYLLSFSGARWIGIITPIGGVAFLLGWAFLGWSVWQAR